MMQPVGVRSPQEMPGGGQRIDHMAPRNTRLEFTSDIRYGSPLSPDFPGFLPHSWQVTEGYGQRYGDIVGLPGNLVGQQHAAVDLWKPDAYGARVCAVADGRVVFVGIPDSGAHKYEELAYQLIIRHDDGMYSRCCHLSKIYTYFGANVARGDDVAAVGNGFNHYAPHLHFSLWKHDTIAKWPWFYTSAGRGNSNGFTDAAALARETVDPIVWIEEHGWWWDAEAS